MASEESLSKQDQIDRYLTGQCNARQKQALEKEMAQDEALQQQVHMQEVLVKSLGEQQRREKMKAFLDQLHAPLGIPQEAPTLAKPSKPPRLRRLLPSLGIAASVLLVASMTFWYIWDNYRSLEKKQSSYYTRLKRDINNVKRKQDILARSQVNQKSSDRSIVNQYGATALVIASEGYLVTNYHVIENADSISLESIYRDSLSLKVETVLADPEKDLAILQVTDTNFIGFSELPFQFRTDEAELGERVYTLAYPRAEIVYGEGSVSAWSGIQGDTTQYQISIPVNPGNSGGPLFDEKGNLIGIVSGKHSEMEGATFAVKARHLEDLISHMVADSTQQPLNLPRGSQLHYLNRPEQVKALKNLVFLVKVFDGKEN